MDEQSRPIPDEIKKIITKKWDGKYIVRPEDLYGMVTFDLPVDIRNRMNLYTGTPDIDKLTGKYSYINDDKILLCVLAQNNDYNVELSVGLQSMTVVVKIHQYLSGKKRTNPGLWIYTPPNYIHKIVEDQDLHL